MQNHTHRPAAAIVCGGTGGHLFPGFAIGEALLELGCDVTAFITTKEIDQVAAQSAGGLATVTLPVLALKKQGWWKFLRACRESSALARKTYQEKGIRAVIAMGAFLSLPATWAARSCGAATFIHEANAVPGRANRIVSWWAGEAFVYFPQCARRLRHDRITAVGMPVRPQFQPQDPAACRVMLGLDPLRPVLLVMGGSQGATAVNNLVLEALPHLRKAVPELQFIHLAGRKDADRVRDAYARRSCAAVVRPFLTEMELAMNAATAAISRAGGSSLAESAALRLPSLLIPYPHAADNHQHHNALAFVESGAARMLSQADATPAAVARELAALLGPAGEKVKSALAAWHQPGAAADIARRLLTAIKERMPENGEATAGPRPAPGK